MNRIIIALSLIAVLWPAMVRAQDGQVVTTTGIGSATCAQLADFRSQAGPEVTEGMLISWAQGFTSGVNVTLYFNGSGGGMRNLTGVDDAVADFVGGHCEDNADATLVDAMIAFFATLPTVAPEESDE